ncbi:MAG: UvrD-helicase domain-containing protein [Clostridia bacterium]|nr:UvrD-helicase domain-containing protein [Clostridia bacterium]
MSTIQFSPDQQNAIHSRGDALLVSAAAGSGKTTVLVERVLRYLKEQKGDIRRLIIMTYTRAAAEEMRMKIKRAVDAAVAAEGGDHLMKQSALIESAQIGTIHSICLDLILRHFEQLELDPRCRLIDESADQQMVEEQAEALIEELYGRGDPASELLLSCFAGGRSDEGLKALLIEGMRFLEKQPLPEDYIARALAPYERRREGLFACFCEDGLYQYYLQQVEELMGEYAHLYRWAQGERYLSRFPKLLAFLEEEYQKIAALRPLLEQRDYTDFRNGVLQVRLGTLRFDSLAEKEGGAEEKERLKARRDRFKKNLGKLIESVAEEEAEELSRLEQQQKLLSAYFSAAMELKDRLLAARRKGALISYQDMEQMAVQLLVAHYDPTTDQLTPTPLAMELRKDYDEIIIDEFQDSNRAQDLIFRALSQEGKNLFMVGDIKQSIYRFRGAEPEIFAEKRAGAERFSQSALKKPTVLELNDNYRSHPDIIHLVNELFGALMSMELGGVVYDERERMNARRAYDRREQPVAQLHHLQPEIDPKSGKKLDTTLQNARYTAAWIKDYVAQKKTIDLPGGGSRPAEYKDFAVLLHTMKGSAPIFERELLRLGIPVTNDRDATPFYDLWEVQSLLSYLMVLNNPYDDVAMVSLLYGDYFRFTVGELAAMRRQNTFLFDDLKEYSKKNSRAREALEKIEGYRKLSGSLYVYELLERILSESGIMEYYLRGERGAEKQACLEEFSEEARAFEQEGYQGLYAFIEHIRLSRKGSRKGVKIKAEQNCVQMMSIHRSKGLEFPICILADLQKHFNLQDKDGKILFHPRYGAAVEQIRPELFSRCRSLGQRVLAAQSITDNISEEERVLYVALTRAQSRLLLIATVPDERIESWVMDGVGLKGPMPIRMIRGKDASYARWILTQLAGRAEGEALRQRFGLLEGDFSPLGITYHRVALQETLPEKKSEKKAPPFDRQALRERMEWRYPYGESVRLPAKLSVSELKGMREADEEAEPLLEEQIRPQRPRFLNHFAPMGNEVGNAIHQALQFCDFEKLMKDPEQELARLVQEGFILEKQRKLIDLKKLRRFTESPSFTALLTADYYSKEERFLFPLPASDLFGEKAEGEILIQGVLDCYSVRGNEAVILDYKTDHVESEEQLIRRYGVQMELYAEALKRIKGLKVVRCEIYSFSLEKTIVL